MTDRAVIGDAPRRREDARFVTGHGAYLDDLRFDGVAHAVFLRSPHAHARISAIDTAGARCGAGRDRRADRAGTSPPTGCRRCARRSRPTCRPTSRSASCRSRCWPSDNVRYVGEPVALIVAETRNQALDAAERIDVDYDPAARGHDARDALAPGAPVLTADVPGNLCLDWQWGQTGRGRGRASRPRRMS